MYFQIPLLMQDAKYSVRLVLYTTSTATLSQQAWRMHDASFTYDLAGRMLTALTDEQTRTWTYDTAGRPSTHVRRQGGTFSYSYDVASNLTGLTYPAEASPAIDLDVKR
jgi:YD repeat-containing protein